MYMLKYYPWLLQQLATKKKTSNPCGPVDSVTSSAFFFPFFSFPPPEQHWHETNIMKYHETTCKIFWEPIRRSESGFDFMGIVSSCWFLYFDGHLPPNPFYRWPSCTISLEGVFKHCGILQWCYLQVLEMNPGIP